MSDQQIKTTAINLNSIKEKLFAGKAAIDESELAQLSSNIEDELKSIVANNSFTKEKNLLPEWTEILKAIAAGNFADSFLTEINKDSFYDLGLYLIKEAKNNSSNNELKKIIHEYLNLFRSSTFLRKIYDEKKWEDLIYELILHSNYTVNTLFNQRVLQYGRKTLFKIIKGNSFEAVSWNETDKRVNSYARSFYNLVKDENPETVKIAFLLENSPSMPLLDLACLTSGIVNIMIPANSVTDHIKYILNQTRAPVIVVHDEKQLAKVKSIKSEVNHLKKAVLLYGKSIEDWVISFNEFVKSGDKISSDDLGSLKNKITTDSLATIMYTSGTTGEPKGIMFSQMNIVYKRFCRAVALPEIGDKDRFLSFLPLFHTFGRWLEMTGSIFWGAEYCFMENPAVETMLSNMQLVQPTVFISIPKKWMQLYEEVTAKVDIEMDDDKIITEAVSNLTGGKLKWGLSAAGYLPPDVFRFFQKYGVELMSGFGLTEATGGVTMTPPNRYKENSLGKALPGIDIKLGEDGEIMIKGHYVMMGYYGTSYNETFTKDGWLPTGDVMTMDNEGFIEIIDRKKEIYKNIKGETIAPQKIENFFREFENVKQVFLVGDHKPFNTVLLFPNYENENSVLEGMDEKQKQEYFSSLIVTVNKFLAPFERILDFRIIDRLFTEDKNELTPKGTYKRRVIEKNFEDTIDSMYTKNYIGVMIKNTEIRVPNWFLREKASLSRDIIADKNCIRIPKINVSLCVEQNKDNPKLYRIGSYNYLISTSSIDMQTLLTNPYYWLGNQELYDFVGEGIYQWYRLQSPNPEIKYSSSIRNISTNENMSGSLKKMNDKQELSLRGIHLAALMLQSNNKTKEKLATDYFRLALEDETNYNYNLALEIASRPNLTSLLTTRRNLLKAIIPSLNKNRIEEILNLYLNHNYNILNPDLIKEIVNLWSEEGVLSILEGITQLQIEKLDEEHSFAKSSVPSLFDLIEAYCNRHPTTFKRIRRFILKHAVFGTVSALKEKAESALHNIQQGLRDWLGQNQSVAVDMETGKEYGWEDVLIFEEGIDAEDRQRMKNAFLKTSILREAIFLFSTGVLLRLDNILPGGVWISHLETKSYKSIYRVTVQTRFQGGFDFTLHLAKNLPPATIREEVKWLILPATALSGGRLVPKFGGYWEEYELWTEQFVPRDSVERYITRTVKMNDEAQLQRLRYLWTYFVWNATVAYMSFWKATNYRIELANPLPENISIPAHDYQTGTLLYSVSKRIKSNSITEFLKNFHIQFVKQTIDRYSFLHKESLWNYIFSGIIEVEGEKEGLSLIKTFKNELKSQKSFPDKEKVLKRIELFENKVENEGFIPKALFFAIKRFHRWFELNTDASFTAQAEMLYELYETYQLFTLEETHPSTRTVFFIETAFIDSDIQFKEALREIARKQHDRLITKDETLNLISSLQTQFKLNEKESFFLTRLSYPYLKPTDSAALLQTASADETASNLVVQLMDDDGNPFLIRKPTSPKEISRLHQLFFESNLMVHFRPDNQFLVALSERGFIIGGLFYNQSDEQTIHMEKIVVADRYRRKGISEGLMNELFNRSKSEHIKYVTTGFFRPEYFYKFGFKIEKKYSGLVKSLTETDNDK